MRLWVLGSGSRGNAVLLESGESRVMIDAGFPVRTLQARLATIGVAPQSISDCIVTHEHVDHARGAAAACARWGWRLHASCGTLRAAPEIAAAGSTSFAAGDTLTLDGFAVQTVATPHDANESVAVVATATATGARAAVCYDLGHASEAVRAALAHLDVLVIEANHDVGMLWSGPYPPSVCERIAGRRGHLSNTDAGHVARGAASVGLRHVVLAHLSEKCNVATVASRDVGVALSRTRFRGLVSSTTQDAVAGPFSPSSAVRARAQQLTLGL